MLCEAARLLALPDTQRGDGRRTPPNPLHLMLDPYSAYWRMPPLCRELDHISPAPFCS
jgi:hypothetical protein